jgi:hypothetical protein
MQTDKYGQSASERHARAFRSLKGDLWIEVKVRSPWRLLGGVFAMTADPALPCHHFHFRLRTLFIIVAIAAVECAVCLPMLRVAAS